VAAADLLAAIHTVSHNDPRAKETFSTAANFSNLRIAPYLLKSAERNPGLREVIYTEAERLRHHGECLVHGDYSPKNLLVCTERLVLLDHEVAWYGDPAFDVAFMLTHLHLKQLVHHTRYKILPDLPRIFWERYFEGYSYSSEVLKNRANKLWLLILLARIDGKSPAEYLEKEPQKQKVVKSFVYEAFKSGKLGREELTRLWQNHLIKLT
jgi:thiamine kinase-like enzyme